MRELEFGIAACGSGLHVPDSKDATLKGGATKAPAFSLESVRH